MKVKKVLSKIWRVVKPVVTLGLPFIMSVLSRKAGTASEIAETAGNAVGKELIEIVDDALEDEE